MVAPVARKQTSASHSPQARGSAAAAGPSYPRVSPGQARASRSAAACPAAVTAISPIMPAPRPGSGPPAPWPGRLARPRPAAPRIAVNI